MAHKLKGLCIDSEAVATEWTSHVCEPRILPCEEALLPTPWSDPSGSGMWSQGAPHGDLSQAQTVSRHFLQKPLCDPSLCPGWPGSSIPESAGSATYSLAVPGEFRECVKARGLVRGHFQ